MEGFPPALREHVLLRAEVPWLLSAFLTVERQGMPVCQSHRAEGSSRAEERKFQLSFWKRVMKLFVAELTEQIVIFIIEES